MPVTFEAVYLKWTDVAMSPLLSSPTTRDQGPRARRWTTDEYHRAAALGLFHPEECLELVDGEIIEKMPPDPPHSGSVGMTADVLARAFSLVDCCVRTENPVTLPNDGEPQPDVAVVIGDHRRYTGRHPQPADVLLLMEIADSSLAYDRETKGPLYAAAGIREYWILNLRERQLEVHRDPHDGEWVTAFIVPADGNLSPQSAPNSTVAVSDMLP
jgi:Uma2 family endonuclease